MDAERGATGTRDVVIDIALLLVAWAAIVALVDPRGDFPLNDDWAYAGSVQMLRDEGVFRLPGWASMTLITQTVWGVLVTAIAGFSYTALRASTLVLGGASLVATYLLARQIRAARAVAVLAALVLAANPLFIVLAHSFMTDVPMLALTLYALLAFGRALQSGSRLAWGVGTLITIAAVLCRQPGLTLAMGFVATAILRPPDRSRWVGLSVVSLLLGAGALWGYQVVMEAFGPPLGEAYSRHVGFLQRLWQMGPSGALPFLVGNLFVALLYAGLFLLPLLIVGAASGLAQRRAWWRGYWAIALAALVIGALSLWSSGRSLPMRANVLIESGLGPITLNDLYIRDIHNDPRLPAAFWWTATAVGVVAAALLVAQGLAVAARIWRERTSVAAPAAPVRALLFANTLLYLSSACIAIQFDRYFMPLVPLFGLALLPTNAGRAAPRWTWLIAALPLVLLAAYGVAGTHDYLAWNRARWEALQQLQRDGVEARHIDGGLEFNAPLFYVEGTSTGGGGRSWWWVADDEYMVTMGPVPGFDVERRVPYSRWLPPGEAAMTVLHRTRR